MERTAQLCELLFASFSQPARHPLTVALSGNAADALQKSAQLHIAT